MVQFEGSIFDFLAMLVIGALAGYLASIVVGTNKEQGCLADIIVGLVGALIGGLVRAFFPGGVLGGVWDTILFSTIGAVILLVLLQAIFRRRRRRR